ncbi:hypothetical protein JTE90_000836 [Oedothorax gibbosus]|uniref:Uncharacterized protein n=1 Tax=Oedothorax gibbosus TaxID=931172 RepID=A0AAV6VVF0_9ARAC|nr:hypothetical protein JTE90_000836 [Oedothorax gibbosus]
MQKVVKGITDDTPDCGDLLTDGKYPQDEDTKEDERQITNSEPYAGIEPVVTIKRDVEPLVDNGEGPKVEENGDNNNEPTAPNQNFVVDPPVVTLPPRIESAPLVREPLKEKETNGNVDNDPPNNKVSKGRDPIHQSSIVTRPIIHRDGEAQEQDGRW